MSLQKCHWTLFYRFLNKNKNTLTGPENCKNRTRHQAPLSCAKSRKTNDAKSINRPKTSIWAIVSHFRGQISPNYKFFWKNRFHSNWRSYTVLTSGPKTKKIVRAVFWEKCQSVWFWANFETFLRVSLNQEFFSKIRLCHFSTFMVP